MAILGNLDPNLSLAQILQRRNGNPSPEFMPPGMLPPTREGQPGGAPPFMPPNMMPPEGGAPPFMPPNMLPPTVQPPIRGGPLPPITQPPSPGIDPTQGGGGGWVDAGYGKGPLNQFGFQRQFGKGLGAQPQIGKARLSNIISPRPPVPSPGGGFRGQGGPTPPVVIDPYQEQVGKKRPGRY